MNWLLLKKLLLTTLLLLIIAHLPFLLLFLGVEFIPIVIWVALIENIPLLFLSTANLDFFKVGKFGIQSYGLQGFIVSFSCKFVFFFVIVTIFSKLALRRHK